MAGILFIDDFVVVFVESVARKFVVSFNLGKALDVVAVPIVPAADEILLICLAPRTGGQVLILLQPES